MRAIELIDSEVFAPLLLKGLDNMGERYRILFLSDHYTPICTRTHDGTPVPYLLYDSGVKTQRGLPYCRESAAAVGNRFGRGHGADAAALRAVSKSKRARGERPSAPYFDKRGGMALANFVSDRSGRHAAGDAAPAFRLSRAGLERLYDAGVAVTAATARPGRRWMCCGGALSRADDPAGRRADL